MDEKIPLSVAIIAFNEEDRLPDCLASVAFAAEVVVVDSGSSDRTAVIAREAGARVFDEPWRGFGAQKQFAIDQCSQEWILVLDADERLAPETAAAIAGVIASPRFDAYRLPRKNIFSGRWIRRMGWWPDRVVRLFRRGRARMSPHQVHESLEVDGPVGDIAAPIIHLTNRDLAHTLDKVNRYSSIGAAEMQARGRRCGTAGAFARAAWVFFHDYVFRAGFLDGGQGLVVAVSDAVNQFFKYAKLKEMNDWQGQLPDD